MARENTTARRARGQQRGASASETNHSLGRPQLLGYVRCCAMQGFSDEFVPMDELTRSGIHKTQVALHELPAWCLMPAACQKKVPLVWALGPELELELELEHAAGGASTAAAGSCGRDTNECADDTTAAYGACTSHPHTTSTSTGRPGPSGFASPAVMSQLSWSPPCCRT